MLRRLRDSLHPSRGNSLARAFERLGSIGFWVQLSAGVLSLLLMVYVLAFNRVPSAPRAGLPLVELFTIAGLLMLAFTTFWFYRYTLLGRRMSESPSPMARSSVIGVVWTGVVATCLGIIFSVLVMLSETARLLFYFLSMPQGGVPVIQTPAAGLTGSVSAIDMVSLMSLVLTLAAEVIALILSLWLLFRSTQPDPKLDELGGT